MAKKSKYIKTQGKPPSEIPNEALLKDGAQYPEDYICERAQRLGCSKSGIESTLKRLSISQKKTLEYPEACMVKRLGYQNRLNNFTQQGYPIVYMDESGSGFEYETIRLYGYTPMGKPCSDSYT